MITSLSAPVPRLTALNLSQNSIGALGLRLLVDGLGKNDTLATLLLAMNNLSSGGVPSQISLQCLLPRGISHDSLLSGAATPFIAGFANCRALKTLDLSRNSLGPSSGSVLGKLLANVWAEFTPPSVV